MTSTNLERQQHGQSAQNGLEQILRRCRYLQYISSFTKTFRAGREGYVNSEQFYVPFLICFEDGSKWAIFTTTSMRTDRIKGQQWDAINLKDIDPLITKAFLVYPDGLSQDVRAEFVRQNQKYQDGFEYSAIDAVVSQEQISNLIERHAIASLSVGQQRDIQGNNFEHRIASIMCYPENLLKWQSQNRTLEGMHYSIFRDVMECLDIVPDAVASIDATADKRIIGRLPSGGNPKTDVIITVHYTDDSSEHFTISCKRSSDSSVSVHQYTADAFANVLDPENENLRYLLNGFQQAGSLRRFGDDNCVALERALAPHLERLSMWVLGGYGGEGSAIQCAQFIMTYKNDIGETSIHSTPDYYHNLIAAGVTGQFGTPFSWTYPSGRRGQSIQLKARIL